MKVRVATPHNAAMMYTQQISVHSLHYAVKTPTITKPPPKSINSQLCNHTCPLKTPIEQISNLSHRQMLTIQNHSLYQQNHTLTPQSKLSVSLYLSSTTHHQLTPQKPCCRKAEPHDSQPCFISFSFSLPLPPCQNYGWLTRRQRYRIPYVRHLFQELNLAQPASQAA